MRIIRILAGMALATAGAAAVYKAMDLVAYCGATKNCHPYDRIAGGVIGSLWLTVVALLLTEGGKSWPWRWRKPEPKR